MLNPRVQGGTHDEKKTHSVAKKSPVRGKALVKARAKLAASAPGAKAKKTANVVKAVKAAKAVKVTKDSIAKKTSATKNEAVSIGQVVPNFEVVATGGQKVSLNGLRGKRVVLYFYPKDATPGCTLEGHDFTRLHSEFQSIGVEVYGVSKDDLSSHEKFKSKECYSIDLLSDSDGSLCHLFDVIKMKNMYGKMVNGIERSTFVIDGDGRLVHEWRKVKVDGHAQAVLEYLKGQG